MSRLAPLLASILRFLALGFAVIIDASKIKPESVPDTAELLQKSVLEAFKEEFSYQSEILRDLDRKSYGTAAVAGVFLAAAFAFIRQGDMSAYQSFKVMIYSSLALLVLSIISALIAIWVREVPGPPTGRSIKNLASILLQGESRELSLSDFYAEQARIWDRAVQKVTKINYNKGLSLAIAQLFLLGAVLCVALATWTKVGSVK